MQLTEIATQLFLKQIDTKASGLASNEVQSELGKLLPMAGGDLDISKLISLFTQNGGLASLAQSWLGDGANETISAGNILAVLGQAKVHDFASNLGIDTDTAASGLSDMIPELIDKASSGGSLQNDIAGSLVKGLAGKFF